MSCPIADLDCIDPDVVDRLKSVGIRTSDKLLDAAKSLRGRKTLAEKTGIDEKSLLSLANKIDRMRVKGIGQDYAKLLQIAGVDTIRELKYRNPKRLAEAMGGSLKVRIQHHRVQPQIIPGRIDEMRDRPGVADSVRGRHERDRGQDHFVIRLHALEQQCGMKRRRAVDDCDSVGRPRRRGDHLFEPGHVFARR